MKSYAITNARLSMLAVTLLFLSGWSAAQAPLGQDPIAQNLFSPELVIAHQKEIGLDDAQKSFIRTELQQAQSHFTDMQWKLKDNMESVCDNCGTNQRFAKIK